MEWIYKTKTEYTWQTLKIDEVPQWIKFGAVFKKTGSTTPFWDLGRETVENKYILYPRIIKDLANASTKMVVENDGLLI